MTVPSAAQSSRKQRRTALRVFYVFVSATIATFTVGIHSSQPVQEIFIALGIALAGGGIWSFVRFLKVADTHQRLINHEATSFAFVGSLLLTLAVGILQRFGFFSGAALLVPALMIVLWSIGLVLFSWRYQE